MSRLLEFLDWLETQDYWVKQKEVDEKWSGIEFTESTGITTKQDEDGGLVIPRRDLRQLATRCNPG